MWNSIFRTVVGAMLLMPVSALAAPEIQLPRTGQTGCWDSAGAVIACAGTGQDGEKQAGVAWPTPRFTDNGNGTITDGVTDLVWLKNADCYGLISWQQALDSSRTLANGACGLNDNSSSGQWRLPNRTELLSIVNYQAANGATWLNSQGFTSSVHGWYWSSDTRAPVPATKWVVHSMGDALSDAEAQSPTSHALFVRDLAGPTAALSPASNDFGNVGVSQPSAPRTFTIANTGAMSLVVSGITTTGTDGAMFVINPGNGSAGTCGTLTPTIAAGASCTVSVVFTPTSTGSKTAALTVASNSAGTTTSTAALAGTGITVSHDVTASIVGENGSVAPSGAVQVVSGSSTVFTLTPAAGFQAATTVGGTCPAGSFSGTTYTTGAITENCTVLFSFVPGTFTISTATSGDGTITCTPGTSVPAATEVSCAVAPATGNDLTAVTVDGTAQTVSDPASFTHSFGLVTADHAIAATFTPRAFTVTFATDGNGSVSGNVTQSIGFNETTTEVTAVPAPGFHFVNWTGEGGFTSTANPLTISNITANRTVTATFAVNPGEADFLADSIKAFQSALGKAQLTEQEKARCDVAPLGEDGRPTPDGLVDVGDVVILLRRLAGLVTW